MVQLLVGDNSFEIERELGRLTTAFDGVAEMVDGSALEIRQLPDLLMGATLFADKRLVVIRHLYENKQVWDALPEWLERLSDDIMLVLVETKPDKRTRTYKTLQKTAEVKEFKSWTERDVSVAERWAVEEAKRQEFTLDTKSARSLVEQTGVDQWRVFHALEKLAVLDTVTPQVIETVIEKNPRENVFILFETAIKGDTEKVQHMLRVLEQTEDPYMVFGLLSSQVFQLAALALSDKPSSEVAKEIGAHPFVLSKLAPYAKKQGRGGVRGVVAAFYEADTAMKVSAGEPWLLIERALVKAATR